MNESLQQIAYPKGLPRDVWHFIAKKLDCHSLIRFRQIAKVFEQDPALMAELESLVVEQWKLWFAQGEQCFLGLRANEAKILLSHCVEIPRGNDRENALIIIYNKLRGIMPLVLNAGPVEDAIVRLAVRRKENHSQLFFDVVCQSLEDLIEKGKPDKSIKKMIEKEKLINSCLDVVKYTKIMAAVTYLPLIAFTMFSAADPKVGLTLSFVESFLSILLFRNLPAPRQIKKNGFVERQFLGHGSFWQYIDNKKENGSVELQLLAANKPPALKSMAMYNAVGVLIGMSVTTYCFYMASLFNAPVYSTTNSHGFRK